MDTVKRKMIVALKEAYRKGDRVKLIEMDDPQAPAAGVEGTVVCVDDVGTVHVNWDDGSSLGVVYKVDRIVKL